MTETNRGPQFKGAIQRQEHGGGYTGKEQQVKREASQETPEDDLDLFSLGNKTNGNK